MKFNLTKLIQPLIILGLLIYIFINRSYNSSPSKNNYQKFQTKEIVGKFEPLIKPKPIPSNKQYITKLKKGGKLITNYPTDSMLVKSYEKATDSTKTNMFVEQVQIRPYKNDFEDKYIKISMFSKVRGELLEIAPEYTIKPQVDSIKVKETTFAIYGGAGLYSSPDATKTGFKVNLRFQNKKGDLFSASYDLLNKIIFAEYDVRIINIKK
jgi:hypothetical protein